MLSSDLAAILIVLFASSGMGIYGSFPEPKFIVDFGEAALANQVCSPITCIDGISESSRTSTSSCPLILVDLVLAVLAVDRSSCTYLIPGHYTSTSSFSISSLSLASSANQTISSTTNSVTVSPPTYPVSFASTAYTGANSVWTTSNWTAEGWRSVYLPAGWYGILSSGQVLWGAIPDISQLAFPVTGSDFKRAASCRRILPQVIVSDAHRQSHLRSSLLLEWGLHSISVEHHC